MVFSLSTLILIIFFSFLALWIAYKIGSFITANRKDLEWQENLIKLRREVAERQRVGIKGRVTEAFAPFLKGYPFKASESKFIGDPIDYLVFEGLDEREIKGIHLVEVKEGSSKLSKHQKKIKDIIDEADSNKITFREFNFRSEEPD